jgi:chromosome partitioning protein
MRDDWAPFLNRTIAVANRKGGVGKSSIVRSVAEEAVRANYRILAVDGDPQGNLSKIDFGLDGRGWEADRGRSLAMALQYETELVPLRAGGVDVVCGGPELMGALGAATANADLSLATNLRASLARRCADQRYDLVLIDSGPGDTKLLDAYMLTARWLIVPVIAGDEASYDGLDKMGARYADLVRSHGAELEFLGAVLTMVDHRAPRRNEADRAELTDALGTAGEPFRAMVRYLPSARTDARKYGLSAAEVAEKAVEAKHQRLAALRRRSTAGRHEAITDKPVRLDDPDAPWFTRDGSGLAGDYQLLTKEILTRLSERLGAHVA